jgi:drug/metabolite transporter (DMT)-like permease
LLTGLFIAGYTVNDGWSVKVLALSPFIIDFSGNLIRVLMLTPFALRDWEGVSREARMYAKPAAVVSVLGPMGYILVLFAMKIAPVSHVAPARELSTLVGTYFGSRLLREESVPARLLGATCILVGVVSLAFAR